MSSPKFLTRFEGTTVTLSPPKPLNPSPELPLHVSPERCQMNERAKIVNQQDASSPNTLAFMRVYKQVPIAGTEFEKAPIRAAQAVNSYEPTELTALRSLEEKGCEVIPRLLGYRSDQQDQDDIVPGGFITYVIWAKVPGESLNIQEFWSCMFSQREEIRLKFRKVYEYIIRAP
ncbi:uncharacterized protein N7479_002050 [Penicillium vulpinum]|uniref:uncharacterized protein n=1 Tax=Penicillium vulpinum TaxID=29845 RepID=UPI002548EE8F|nr:uncharacterized protein N7479_002050 [Penicillium vulpinum]KAJ5972132.1 hypothetical protein N7479_002050 [Penicillium vulpinum]